MTAMRLAVVGGSGASTPELIDALAAWPGDWTAGPASRSSSRADPQRSLRSLPMPVGGGCPRRR